MTVNERARQKKLLWVVNVDWFFASHRLPIAAEALRLGYEVHVATGVTNLRTELERRGFTVHPLKLNRSSTGLLSAWRLFTEIVRIFRAVQPDVVHLVTIKPVLLGGIAARLARVPAVVFAVSGLGFVFVGRGFWARLRRWVVSGLYGLALGHRNRKVIFQNPSDLEIIGQAARLPASAVELIRGSGVDLSQYVVTPLPGGAPLVVLASRMLADKGVREFVEAARLLRSRKWDPLPLPRFALVGQPDPDNPASLTEPELQRWASEGAVEWWGQRSDMPQVFASAHIVALPSYYGEGLPKVLIEAAACGRAVVTTDMPGCRDAIDPGKTGLLVPARDPKALAQVLQRLLEDAPLRRTMGEAGRALAEKAFDVRQVVAAHARIYGELSAQAE